jgi:hypothetical protein
MLRTGITTDCDTGKMGAESSDTEAPSIQQTKKANMAITSCFLRHAGDSSSWEPNTVFFGLIHGEFL